MELPEGTNSVEHLDFSPVKLILDSWFLEVEDNIIILFDTTKSMVICYSSKNNLIQLDEGYVSLEEDHRNKGLEQFLLALYPHRLQEEHG